MEEFRGGGGGRQSSSTVVSLCSQGAKWSAFLFASVTFPCIQYSVLNHGVCGDTVILAGVEKSGLGLAAGDGKGRFRGSAPSGSCTATGRGHRTTRTKTNPGRAQSQNKKTAFRYFWVVLHLVERHKQGRRCMGGNLQVA